MRLIALKWRESRLVLLAALLLFAQTSAILHGYAHRDAVRQDGAAGTEQCLYCKASAPLLGAAGVPAALALVLPVALLLQLLPKFIPAFATFRHVAFRSRAPPGLS